MKIGFTVGAIEQHRMELSFDQKSGDLRILMDGAEVLEDRQVLARERARCYELNIGEGEKHRLTFQLIYGDEQEEPSTRGIPRLMVRAIL